VIAAPNAPGQTDRDGTKKEQGPARVWDTIQQIDYDNGAPGEGHAIEVG